MVKNILNFLNHFKKIFNQNTAISVTLLIIFFTLFGACVFLNFESPDNKTTSTFVEALWSSFVFLAGINSDGHEVYHPVSRVVTIIITFAGMIALGSFLAIITAIFVERRLKEGMGLMPVTCKDHIIICGWNYKADEMICQLRSDENKEKFQPIVILADNITEKPSELIDFEDVYFVKGDGSNEADLIKANIMEAKNAIILADVTRDNRLSNIPDAKSILISLAIETINPGVYTCVEVIDSANIPHFKRCHADEIIAISEISGKLMVQAALNHGISELVSDILTFGEGSE
ncbi:MAG TPA: NAD-binding protein, partial [Candidatus Wallbacteria bacterium]|nr:NAD-binding protein [Candidatus Wallbacteria bacterium]